LVQVALLRFVLVLLLEALVVGYPYLLGLVIMVLVELSLLPLVKPVLLHLVVQSLLLLVVVQARAVVGCYFVPPILELTVFLGLYRCPQDLLPVKLVEKLVCTLAMPILLLLLET
jgi:hypothetical protein